MVVGAQENLSLELAYREEAVKIWNHGLEECLEDGIFQVDLFRVAEDVLDFLLKALEDPGLQVYVHAVVVFVVHDLVVHDLEA